MIAGWDLYFLKVLLASCEDRLSFFQESQILTKVDVKALCKHLRLGKINYAKKGRCVHLKDKLYNYAEFICSFYVPQIVDC